MYGDQLSGLNDENYVATAFTETLSELRALAQQHVSLRDMGLLEPSSVDSACHT